MKGITSSIIIIAVLVVCIAAVFLFNQMQKAPPSFESTEEKPPQKKLVPITFRLAAPGAEQVKIIFPVFGVCCNFRFENEGFMMSKRGEFFEAVVELPENGIIKYGYTVESPSDTGFDSLSEDTKAYRIVHVKKNLTITDEAYSPNDVERSITLNGAIHDSEGNPVLDAIIAIDGIIDWERGDGTYALQIRPGRHQLIIWKMDGSHKTHSQIIDVNEDKKLDIVMEKAKPVKVKINADATLPPSHKLRMFSNSEQTGHRRLAGNWIETSTFLEFEKSIELDLYEGQYFEYMYTIGNLFNGFEHDGENWPVIRHFTVREGLVVNDVITHIGQENDILLNVKARLADPYDAVEVDVEGILGGAMLMHKKGDKEWVLKTIPEGYKGSKYRYFRNAQPTEKEKREDRILALNNNDFIDAWEFQSRELPKQSFEMPEIKNSFHIFPIFPDLYAPDIDMVIKDQMNRIAEKGYPGFVLSQIWGFPNYPEEPTIKRALYMSAYDLKKLVSHAKSLGLKTAISPGIIGTFGPGDVPIPGPKEGFSQEWWEKHMDEVERFNIYNAKTAEAAGIDYLIVQPISAYTTDEHPDFNQRMKDIIKKMREYYSGKLVAEMAGLPEVDTTYITNYWMDADVVAARVQASWERIGYTTTQEEANRIMAEEIDKYKRASELSGKPFIMQQFSVGTLEEPPDNPTNEQIENHLERQKKVLQAVFTATNDRDWIEGIWLFPYNFNDGFERIDPDFRGKPADKLAATWARKISGKE